jgi:hypothetical protein
METPHSQLRQKVLAELDAYEVPEPHPEAMGLTLPPSWFSVVWLKCEPRW